MSGELLSFKTLCKPFCSETKHVPKMLNGRQFALIQGFFLFITLAATQSMLQYDSHSHANSYNNDPEDKKEKE